MWDLPQTQDIVSILC